VGILAEELEMDVKCIKCRYQASIAHDPDIPIRCQKCGGFVVIEDYTILTAG
jgi:ribosomal protein S27E